MSKNTYCIERLRRKLKRCRERLESMEKLHTGHEADFTYHGGFALGYLRAQVSEIEDFIDLLESINDE